MCRWTIGKAYPAMTVDIQLLAMNATSAKIANMTIAPVAAPIARFAIRQSVWDVVLHAQNATSRSVIAVPLNVKNAKRYFVNVV